MTAKTQVGAEACTWCDAPLSHHQVAANKGCGAPECERSRIAELAKTETQRHLDDHDKLKARLRSDCESILHEVADVLKADPSTLQIALVPYNGKAVTALPQARKAAFEAHLRTIATEGFEVDNPDIYTSKYIRMAIDQPEAGITDAACATCMGDCCKAGGPSWGFTDMTTVCRFRVANPEATADDFCAYYLKQLPELSVEDNCVFQSQIGCTLARADRADLCNSFRCRGVNRILELHAQQTARSTVIIAQHEGVARAVGLFDGRLNQLSEVLPVEIDA